MRLRNHDFGSASRRERHDADLFFADLMGSTHASARRWQSRRATREVVEDLDEASTDGPRPQVIRHPQLGHGLLMPTSAAMTPPSRPTPGARPAASSPAAARRESADEQVFPPDDRQLVTDTTAIAFRFVCCLDLLFTNPSDTTQTFVLRGTGTLISNRHVLTAAHNILNRMPGATTRATATRVFAAPGRNDRTLPFGESRSATLRVTPEWTAAANAEFDYGLITLENDIGATTHAALGGAQLGFWSHPRLGGGTHIRPLDVAFLRGGGGRPVNLDGYPIDKCRDRPAGRAARPAEIRACTGSVPGNPRLMDIGSTQWRSFGRVLDPAPTTEPRSMTYDLDSEEGHSGGPIWLRWQQYRNIVAINTGGYPSPTPPHTIIANMGVRITDEVLGRVRAWMRADGVTPTF